MIKNEAQLQTVFMNKVAVALDNTTKILLDKLVEIVQTKIYDSYTPIGYERTYEFRDSWEKMTYPIKGNIVQSEIWQEYAEMIWDADKWQHGNGIRRADANELADIFNSGLKSANMDITYAPNSREWTTGFWDEFIVYTNANLDRIFQQECAKLGMPLRSGVGSGVIATFRQIKRR